MKGANLVGLRTPIYASKRKDASDCFVPSTTVGVPTLSCLPLPCQAAWVSVPRFLVLPHLVLGAAAESHPAGQTDGNFSANFGKQTSYGISGRIHHSLRRRIYLNTPGNQYHQSYANLSFPRALRTARHGGSIHHQDNQGMSAASLRGHTRLASQLMASVCNPPTSC